jgi:hypothetical protein
MVVEQKSKNPLATGRDLSWLKKNETCADLPKKSPVIIIRVHLVCATAN